jgi:hypothetical protein
MRVLCAAAVQYEIARDCDDPQVMAQARMSVEDYFNEDEDDESVEDEAE